MLQALPHLVGFTLPFAVWFGVRQGGPWVLLPLPILFLLVPLADALVARGGQVSGGPAASLERNPWFRTVTWIWVPVQLGLLGSALLMVSEGLLTPLEAAGLGLSVGLTTGAVGITFAHELIHRTGRFERALGEVLLATVGYAHFAIEHVLGHHRYVATPRDPATARSGEGLWAFLPRSVLGGVASAWRLERSRLRTRRNAVLGPQNRMLRYAATQILLWVAVAAAFGLPGVLLLGGQALVAITLVETINYVEHYGLERRQTAPGRYERVQPWHSWDSNHRISNWLLINLARHADHHVTASKRYQSLDTAASAPQLPAGYGTMFLLALVPPLWRRVMDPRVRRWRAAHLA